MKINSYGAMTTYNRNKPRKGRSSGPIKTLSRSNIRQATAKGTGSNVVKV